MKEAPQVGDSCTYVLKTTEEMSASRFQDSSPPVFATPFLLGAVEASAARLMERWLEPGEMTVGGGVELRHTAATPLGWDVRAVARLVESKGKKFVFAVECFDDLEKIGEARHTRFVIDAAAFLEQVKAKEQRRQGQP
ncbi:MAG: thioesterase family protein [Deltaproteobacteria bacterium]|nr:thioesterase family protein [Deltaproteobacteria bacterium]